MDEIVTVWQSFLQSLDDWRRLIRGVRPKVSGCGLIYELANPIERQNESFAIADMRNISLAQPHYHVEAEIYFGLEGRGIVVIGGKEEFIQKNSAIVIPPNIAHFTIPKDLVLAVVTTPPFKEENFKSLTDDNKEVGFDLDQFRSYVTLANT
jgi:mannose-6-phosphate isomerase-like protein (cupin superfamily)